ncbi:unnamed protein product, partial [Meganyctiphanes norvegica]
ELTDSCCGPVVQAVLSVHCGWFSVTQAAQKFSLDMDLIKYHVGLNVHFSTNYMEPKLTIKEEKVVAMGIFNVCKTKKFVKNWHRCRQGNENLEMKEVIYKDADSIDICTFLNLILHVLERNKYGNGIEKLSWEWVKSFLNRHSYLKILAYVNARNIKLSMNAAGVSIEAAHNEETAAMLESAFNKSSIVEEDLHYKTPETLRPKSFEEWKQSLLPALDNRLVLTRSPASAVTTTAITSNQALLKAAADQDMTQQAFYSSLSSDVAHSLSVVEPEKSAAVLQSSYPNKTLFLTGATTVAQNPNATQSLNLTFLTRIPNVTQQTINVIPVNLGIHVPNVAPTNHTKQDSSLISYPGKKRCDLIGKESELLP